MDILDVIADWDYIGRLFNRWGAAGVLIVGGGIMAAITDPPTSYVGFGLIAAGIGVLIWAIATNDTTKG
jgi:hypothetical protein